MRGPLLKRSAGLSEKTAGVPDHISERSAHDITAILTAHRERTLAGIGFRSLQESVDHARVGGLSVQSIVLLDDPDDLTSELFDGLLQQGGFDLYTVAYRDQGQARNFAAGVATGRYIAFLDADDLWCEDWLLKAFHSCECDPGRTIAHPELDWFFGTSNSVFFHTDQRAPEFDANFLRFSNYWDALCMAPREAYLNHPYPMRDMAAGYAYEDWQWNIETIEAGFVHTVVPYTIHFKRRRDRSQTIEASSANCLVRASPLHGYDWAGTPSRAAVVHHSERRSNSS